MFDSQKGQLLVDTLMAADEPQVRGQDEHDFGIGIVIAAWGDQERVVVTIEDEDGSKLGEFDIRDVEFLDSEQENRRKQALGEVEPEPLMGIGTVDGTRVGDDFAISKVYLQGVRSPVLVAGDADDVQAQLNAGSNNALHQVGPFDQVGRDADPNGEQVWFNPALVVSVATDNRGSNDEH